MNEPMNAIKKRWDDNARRYDGLNQDYMGDEWAEILKSQLPPEKDAVIVDVGGGTGFLTMYAARLGYSCTCVDLSEGMLKIAAEHAEDEDLSVRTIQSGADVLPFDADSVDAIMNRWLLWTLMNPQECFAEWKRVLKPGGRLLCFCTVADKKDGYVTENHYADEVEQLLPLRDASKEKLVAALQEADFAEVEAIRYDGLVTHDPEYNSWYLIKGVKK